MRKWGKFSGRIHFQQMRKWGSMENPTLARISYNPGNGDIPAPRKILHCNEFSITRKMGIKLTAKIFYRKKLIKLRKMGYIWKKLACKFPTILTHTSYHNQNSQIIDTFSSITNLTENQKIINENI